jgi:predicted porin
MKKLVLAAALAAAGMSTAQAVEMKAGDWTVNVGGIINAYYTYVNCDGNATGGLASAGVGCGGNDSRTTIGNGLLPSGLITSVKGNKNGYDIGGTIGIMVHAATNSGVAENSNVDVRQAFLTIGQEGMGSVKIGRDYGIFGANAILSDMTLLGVGAPVQATQRGRVTLGHIGAGYAYLGTYGQIAYTTPEVEGVKLTAALVSPVDTATNISGNGPQFQAVASYSPAQLTGLKAWIGYKHQKFDATPGAPAFFQLDPATGAIVQRPGVAGGQEFRMNAGEIGASYNAGQFGLLANYQRGDGLGIVTDGDQGDTKQEHWLVQGTFSPVEKVKLGLSYGQSENVDAIGAQFENNRNLTAGVYYSLTKEVTLVGEISTTRSELANGAEDRMKGAAVGAIFFF